jgi:tellurite methyltransferase
VKSMSQPFWEAAYADFEAAVTFGKPAKELIELVDFLPESAKILDLGCGEGRNTLFLAEKGFNLEAVDISQNGIDKLNYLARRNGLSVKAIVQDMKNYRFESEFDLIVAHGCLHLIERDNRQKLISAMKAHTKPGSYNVVAVFTDVLPPPDDLKEFHVGLFKEGELFDLYRDWKIVSAQSYIFKDEHPGGIRHTHPINKIVARKKSE